MDDKKKIVIATEDILSKSLEDIFINIDLKRTFQEMRKDRFDNNFDLYQQFRKERNASRSFRIYGIVDSTATDCDNLTIDVYSDSGLTQQIDAVQTSALGFGDKNVFGKMRGKYIIELDNYTDSDVIWIRVQGDGATYDDIIDSQRLVFYGADGEFIEYGTETLDIGIGGGFETINNDFPFFYDKHWIKKNFDVTEVKQRNVSFLQGLYDVNEGEDVTIELALSEPSVFGFESVEVDITTPTTEEYDTAAPVLDFTPVGITFPYTITWAAGEQNKEFDISAIADFLLEKDIEYFTLTLSNNQNSTLNEGTLNITSTVVNISDQDVTNMTVYNFQNIIKNISPVSDPVNYPESLMPIVPGVELNVFGAKFIDSGTTQDIQNQRFYPNDRLEIEIINQGNTTILPIIPGYSTVEQMFQNGESITLSVENLYQNHSTLPLEVAVLEFKQQIFSSNNGYATNFFINGIDFGSIGMAANLFVPRVEAVYSGLGLEMPFNIEQDGATVTLTAKHPTDKINVFIPSGTVQVCGWQTPGGIGSSVWVCEDEVRFALVGDVQGPSYTGFRATTITDQVPHSITLNSNFNNNTECRYEFNIKKPGYKDINVAPQNIPANQAGNEVYLVSAIRNLDAPGPPYNAANVCDLSASTYDTTGYYMNGAALIANAISYNGPLIAFNPVYPAAIAENSHSSGFVAEFRNSPLSSEITNCNGIMDLSKLLA